MSSAAEGWYVDPSTGTNLRFWSGSTWTDEVAPLPPDAPHLDQFTTAPPEPEPEPEPDAGATEHPPLDSDLEHTQLTRRELRARRGTDPDLNDAPRHLPPMDPAPRDSAAMVAAPAAELPLDIELEIEPIEKAGPLAPEQSVEDATGPSRRRRIVRLSVLLGILTVVSSVGVLTAASL